MVHRIFLEFYNELKQRIDDPYKIKKFKHFLDLLSKSTNFDSFIKYVVVYFFDNSDEVMHVD
jgi:hypothetical protein